jgi:2Fe-2S iron-sulfur cluster binding domain
LRVVLTVNGRPWSGEVPARLTLSDLLRDRLGLTGTHVGCEQGVCGACTILADGQAVRSCLLLAVQADGMQVTTIEGMGAPGRLSTLQAAFLRHLPQGRPRSTGRHRHRRADRHARTRTVVTGSGRSRYCAPGSGACSASRPAGRACSLATGARVGPALAIPPRRWREGQVHDGWNREMVQRRQGLRLHRP